MGRAETYLAEGLMTAAEVAGFLLETCPTLRYYKAFMFGSSLHGIGSDYDVLVVGPSGAPLVRLKSELRAAGAELPLDILYMVPEEAEDTAFVARKGCIPLSLLARSLCEIQKRI
ncbi:hypothetical protein ALQ89_05206 [Pseudomonas amygdali pv. tabaci]|uniref:Polymerase nucleotidyl transferase domain-containing protein n=1 Tax=Pseudomonas amygdali pv. tabaci TaxID=322 RepID=A0AAX1VRF1_PSEAJ|nr:hypothetical protein ALQ89_05206 [Pseudomonas amygdali pv. tabaci]BCS44423.1 hypothetical protein Pta6605_27540 [Pseudomonas amygdali pv. tabaci]